MDTSAAPTRTSPGSRPTASRTSGVSSPDGVAVRASVVPLVAAWRVDKTFDYAVPDKLAGRIETGTVVRIPFGHRKVRGIVRTLSESPPEGLEAEGLQEIAGVVVPGSMAPGPLGDLLDLIAERYVTPRGRVFDRVVPPRVRVRPGELSAPHPGPQPERLPAYEGGPDLLADIAEGRASTWVLQALPDEAPGALISEMVGACLGRDAGGALVMVPEVRYGSGIMSAMSAVFGAVSRLDSAQPEGDRSRSWLEVAAGARVAAGGRSAVMAPMPDLRLLVVDEAHSRTYKEDRSPRYDARVVAIERARLQGAVCVFVSSTPPLDLGADLGDRGIRTARPARSLRKAARPLVQLVDPPDSGLSRELHHAVRDTLREGNRVGLLAPVTGYARAVWCSACRRSVRCGRCEAGMILERSVNRLRCPRCGESLPPPGRCPSCGAPELRLLGAGSERLAEQIQKAFPRASVHRMDPQVLASGAASSPPEDADIYLTTWIGVKDVLRPPVATVGVLDADTWIRRPDFRASENAFQALAEMAAWAGPASRGGRLIIQTAEPGHHSVQAVVRGDPDFFAERELVHRAELGYPPYSTLVKVRAEGPERDPLIDQVRRLARSSDAKVLGPVPVSTRVGPTEAVEVLLKCPDPKPVTQGLRGILPQAPRGSRLVVDVDPR